MTPGVNQMCTVLMTPGVNQMCTVLMTPGVNPIAFYKIYHIYYTAYIASVLYIVSSVVYSGHNCLFRVQVRVAVLIYQTIRHHIPDDCHLNIHDRKNKKCV
jgi:hypothetical protein